MEMLIDCSLSLTKTGVNINWYHDDSILIEARTWAKCDKLATKLLALIPDELVLYHSQSKMPLFEICLDDQNGVLFISPYMNFLSGLSWSLVIKRITRDIESSLKESEDYSYTG